MTSDGNCICNAFSIALFGSEDESFSIALYGSEDESFSIALYGSEDESFLLRLVSVVLIADNILQYSKYVSIIFKCFSRLLSSMI